MDERIAGAVYLSLARHPGQSRLDLAQRLFLTERDAQRAICRLVWCGQIIPCRERRLGLPAYQVVTRVGPCEVCGLFDHHLAAGLCTACMSRSRDAGLALVAGKGCTLPEVTTA